MSKKKEMAIQMKLTVEKLRSCEQANKSLGERLELVYAMLEHGKGVQKFEGIKHEAQTVCPSFLLEKMAAELLMEEKNAGEELQSHIADAERYLSRDIGESLAPAADSILRKFQHMAFQLEHAANQALKAEPDTRSAFVRVFFSRLEALRQEINETLHGKA